MDTPHPIRLAAAIAGGAALIGMGALTACSGEKTPAPETSSTTTSASPSVEPGEKSMDPRSGNQFTPSKTANPAPSVAPGQHHPPGAGG